MVDVVLVRDMCDRELFVFKQFCFNSRNWASVVRVFVVVFFYYSECGLSCDGKWPIMFVRLENLLQLLRLINVLYLVNQIHVRNKIRCNQLNNKYCFIFFVIISIRKIIYVLHKNYCRVTISPVNINLNLNHTWCYMYFVSVWAILPWRD